MLNPIQFEMLKKDYEYQYFVSKNVDQSILLSKHSFIDIMIIDVYKCMFIKLIWLKFVYWFVLT